jgi:hypothetical protein
MNIQSSMMTTALTLLVLSMSYGAPSSGVVEQEDLNLRRYTTWEGTYSFSEEIALGIEGLGDLRIYLYRQAGKGGTLITFASVLPDGKLRVLLEADVNTKGVVPTFDGVDVLVGAKEAEIFVRWKHPGVGGGRTFQKYRLSTHGLVLVSCSHLVRKGRELKWISDESAELSMPAEYTPRK